MVENIADDVLDGIDAIAAFRGEAPRRTAYLVQTGQIPVGRIGRRIVGSKRVLRAHYERVTSGGDHAPA